MKCIEDCKNCKLKGCIKKGICGECGARLVGNEQVLYCLECGYSFIRKEKK